MRDVLGWRKKFGVLGPSTNTIVQPDFDMMRPAGVTNHYSRIFTPNANAVSNETLHGRRRVIANNVLDAVRSVMTCSPDYLVMGMSAMTFFGGAKGADEFQARRSSARPASASASASHSCTAALKAYGACKRIAFLTPYYPVANDTGAAVFRRLGFDGGARHLPAVPELDRHRRGDRREVLRERLIELDGEGHRCHRPGRHQSAAWCASRRPRNCGSASR